MFKVGDILERIAGYAPGAVVIVVGHKQYHEGTALIVRDIGVAPELDKRPWANGTYDNFWRLLTRADT